MMLTPVNNATAATPTHLLTFGGKPTSRPKNSPMTTPNAAMAAGYITSPSTQPTMKPIRGPNASRAYTYLPPACGWRVASSAKQSAPKKASTPPSSHATNVNAGRPSSRATSPGVRKIPAPTMMPMTMASPSKMRSERRSWLLTVLPAIDLPGVGNKEGLLESACPKRPDQGLSFR